jgi:hypothetical protein
MVGKRNLLIELYPQWKEELEKRWSIQNLTSLADATIARPVYVILSCKEYLNTHYEFKITLKNLRIQLEKGKITCQICKSEALEENFLYKKRPDLEVKFSLEKNDVKFREVFISSNYMTYFWWVCTNHVTAIHYQTQLLNVLKGTGCPYCANHNCKALEETSLFTLNSKLMKEWSPNNTLDPKTVRPGSCLKAIWICEVHGEYEQRIDAHVDGHRCPKCHKSKGEKAIESILMDLSKNSPNIYFKPQHETFIDNHRRVYDFQVKITSDNRTVTGFIEFDGVQHFEHVVCFGENSLELSNERDLAKNLYCLKSSYPLLRIASPKPNTKVLKPGVQFFLDQLGKTAPKIFLCDMHEGEKYANMTQAVLFVQPKWKDSFQVVKYSE